ncbi:MAG: DUF58 domain-containing protein [Lachnospiraceae bacterium]|nr:DUF58 domain-containing protein [Lachnospiraceae bacterium]
MLLFLMLLAAVIAYEIQKQVFRIWYKKGLVVKIGFQSDYILQGQTGQVREVIENRKWMPLPVVHVSFHTGNGLEFKNQQNMNVSDTTSRRDAFSLLWNQRITRSLTFQGKQRGHYFIETADINVYNFLMTKKYYIEQKQTAQIYVYPKHISTEKLNILMERIFGMQQGQDRFYEDILSFAAIRDYIPGDEKKRINQKASAKAGKLLVNVYDSVMAQKVVILLDVSDKGIWKQQDLTEEGIALAASLSQRLLKAGNDVAIYSNGRAGEGPLCIPFGRDHGKLHRICRGLSDIDLTKVPEDTEKMIARAVRHNKELDGIYLLISKNAKERYDISLKEQLMEWNPKNFGNVSMHLLPCHRTLTGEKQQFPMTSGVEQIVWEVEG